MKKYIIGLFLLGFVLSPTRIFAYTNGGLVGTTVNGVTIIADDWSNGGTSGTSDTFNATCTGNMVLVFVHFAGGNTQPTMSSATYDGTPLILENSATSATINDVGTFEYYLQNQNTGTNVPIAITFTSTADDYISYDCISGAQKIDSSGTNIQTNSTYPSYTNVPIATTHANELIIDGLSTTGSATLTATSTMAQLFQASFLFGTYQIAQQFGTSTNIGIYETGWETNYTFGTDWAETNIAICSTTNCPTPYTGSTSINATSTVSVTLNTVYMYLFAPLIAIWLFILFKFLGKFKW